MSERPRRSRRRRRRPAVIEEGGQEDGAQVESSSGDAQGRRTERRRGERIQKDGERRNTILGMPRFIFFIMAGLFTIVVVMPFAQELITDTSTDIDGVEQFPDPGRRHLAAGETLPLDEYNSFPPTSGPQAIDGAPPGIYAPDAEDEAFREVPPFAELLPILEQGGIVIYYDPDRLSDTDVEALQNIFVQSRREAGLDLLTLVALDDSLPAAIVATAWRHAMEIDVLDEDALDLLTEFIQPDPVGLYERFLLEPAADSGSAAEGS